MKNIVDLKNNFIMADVYRVYSACMFEPTWEKFRERAENLSADPNVRVFGCFEDDALLGVIAVRKMSDYAEICGIAVEEKRRGCGIGGKLVRYVMDMLKPDVLSAETDDDAVEFYRKAGFLIEEFAKVYDSGVYRRYRCTLRR